MPVMTAARVIKEKLAIMKAYTLLWKGLALKFGPLLSPISYIFFLANSTSISGKMKRMNVPQIPPV